MLLSDRIILDRFTHPELFVPPLTTALVSQTSQFESVTSYWSWNWSESNKFVTKTSNKPTWEINTKVNHELFIVKGIPFVISDMKIKPCCLYLHRLGGWLKGEKKCIGLLPLAKQTLNLAGILWLSGPVSPAVVTVQ